MTVHSQRVCVFCGASGAEIKITKEHVLPSWLRTRAQVNLGLSIETVRVNGSRVGKPRIALPFNRQARIACLHCNTGWMRELEERARPFLLPMLDGFEVRLDSDVQQIVAAWAAKTCLAVARARSDFRIQAPSEHYRHLAESMGDSAPEGTGIWLALDQPGSRDHLMAFSARTKTIANENKSMIFYGLMLRLHRLIIQVIGPVEPDRTIQLVHMLSDRYVCKVWPLTSHVVSWPPPGNLSEVGGFDELAGRTTDATTFSDV